MTRGFVMDLPRVGNDRAMVLRESYDGARKVRCGPNCEVPTGHQKCLVRAKRTCVKAVHERHFDPSDIN